MKSINVEILSNTHICDSYYLLEFIESDIAKNSQPGQFLQLLINQGISPLLRRPFSIFDVHNNKISILYKIVGKGTACLKRKKIGEKIGVVAPLGNGFQISEGFDEAILVGGGIGVAPLLFLANKLKIRNINVSVLCGFKTSKEVAIAEYFSDFALEISTDDGSAYSAGFITELLERQLNSKKLHKAKIYACGPKPMMRAVAKIADKYSISCELSLEERMACGIGSCLGCVIKTKEGYQRVCMEGPVFFSQEIEY